MGYSPISWPLRHALFHKKSKGATCGYPGALPAEETRVAAVQVNPQGGLALLQALVAELKQRRTALRARAGDRE